MPRLIVPVYFDEQPSRNRLSVITEKLGEFAPREMTFTEGRPGIELGEPTLIAVLIDDPVDAAGVVAATPEQAARNVVARALQGAGFTMENSRIDEDGIMVDDQDVDEDDTDDGSS